MLEGTEMGHKMTEGAPKETQESNIERKDPEVTAARAALVKRWEKDILASKKHFEDDFKRMRKDMQLAYAGAEKEWIDADHYVVPIILRHINQAVASLYAKNPQVMAERKKRMDYVLWDGRPDTLKAAMESAAAALTPAVDPITGMQMPAPPIDPNITALLGEVSQVQQRNIMMKRVCKTVEIVLRHYIGEQSQNFKKQLKQLVRRVKTCGVGYLWLGYQRKLEKRPEIMAQIADFSAQLARIESLTADLTDKIIDEDSAKRDELESMIADLERQAEVIVREGPVFDFPRSTEIIIDKKCKQINGLIGAGWVVREFYLCRDDVQDIYKRDIGTGYVGYEKQGSGEKEHYVKTDGEASAEAEARVWEVWNRTAGQTFTMIEGYSDFIKEPAAPDILLERFWPLFVLTFNDVEHESKLYPLSDVYLLRHTQNEYNRSRQMRRLHRISNTPMYISVKGRLSEEDKVKLGSPLPFAIVELNALATGENAETLLQPFKGMPFDSAMYETNTEMEDVMRTVGAQEANIGGSSGSTATEASIGENSRISSADSNVDDLDEFLSDVMKATGEMCLLALDVETVKRIAGPGAQWPQMSRSEMVEETSIEIKAGSSGRPNAAAELANMERALPQLLQMDGVKMTPFGEKYANLLDIDLEEALVDGVPSQVALNAMASKLTSGGGIGTPMGGSNVPGMQGSQGGNNAPVPKQVQAGPQPEFPAPGPGV